MTLGYFIKIFVTFKQGYPHCLQPHIFKVNVENSGLPLCLAVLSTSQPSPPGEVPVLIRIWGIHPVFLCAGKNKYRYTPSSHNSQHIILFYTWLFSLGTFCRSFCFNACEALSSLLLHGFPLCAPSVAHLTCPLLGLFLIFWRAKPDGTDYLHILATWNFWVSG